MKAFKILWVKEGNAISHNVFNPFQIKFNFGVTIVFSSANAFNLDQSKKLLFDKGLMMVRFLADQQVLAD